MRKDNEKDLLITKFRSSPKEKQDQLLSFLFTDNIPIDTVIDFLNNKELAVESLGFKSGDMVLIDPDKFSSYPEIDKEWYKKQDLLINDQYISLKVEYINPVSSHIGMRFRTKQNKIVELLEISTYYIPNQNLFEVMLG